MKKTEAEIHLSVMCDCPHCNEYINLYSYLSGRCIDIYKYAELKWEIDVVCPECKKGFEVTLNN